MSEAEAKSAAPSAELLEWPKKDNRRLLHAVYRVGDLDRTIKFYTEALGMKLLRKRDIPEEKYSNAFLGFGPEESHFVVELTYNYGVSSYDIGLVLDISPLLLRCKFSEELGLGAGNWDFVLVLVEEVRAKGGNVTREPGPDPDGYTFEIIQRPSTPEPLCQVMLRVGDLERSIKFYEKALGLKLLRTIERPEYKEDQTTILELTYNYGVTEYTKGNAYAQIAIGTDDVYKSAEVVNLVTQELGGKITRQPGPIPDLTPRSLLFWIQMAGKL
ncbi:glyoxalase I homolog, partial [Prunus dulcis]